MSSISRLRSVLLGPGRFGCRRKSRWRRWSSSHPCGRARWTRWSYGPFSTARIQTPGLSEMTVSRYVARRRVEIRLERREVSIPQTYMWVFGVRPAPDRFVHQGKLVQLNTFDDKAGQFGPCGHTALLCQRKNLLSRRAQHRVDQVDRRVGCLHAAADHRGAIDLDVVPGPGYGHRPALDRLVRSDDLTRAQLTGHHVVGQDLRQSRRIGLERIDRRWRNLRECRVDRREHGELATVEGVHQVHTGVQLA